MEDFLFCIWAIDSAITSTGQALKWLFSEGGSHVIYNLGLGIGAILGGIGGFNWGWDSYHERQRRRLIKEYKSRYPNKEKGPDGWELTHNPDRRGHLYLLDHKTKTRHWIANWRTFQDLFIDVPKYEDQKNNEFFVKYTEGDEILTVGEREP